jgi:hypothetical protein
MGPPGGMLLPTFDPTKTSLRKTSDAQKEKTSEEDG